MVCSCLLTGRFFLNFIHRSLDYFLTTSRLCMMCHCASVTSTRTWQCVIMCDAAVIRACQFKPMQCSYSSGLVRNNDETGWHYVIVRRLSTVEYTSVASLFHCRQWSDYLNNSWPWIGLVCRCGLFTFGWMCALKGEQARREWESDLQHVISLQTLL